jgi:hypothetical protein
MSTTTTLRLGLRSDPSALTVGIFLQVLWVEFQIAPGADARDQGY